ncbi:unnamed protein product [Aspergillus oryzae]|uniref:Unnamed protein product n=2 Tax=Aspergillus oryzae TaxID=5062 RepID=A0AAN4YV14_ASPOZ|nr:unnamed protein product [Aspergillus oryzae]GMF88521.1 unnamed protein product [Aspergillus oryzae]GMG00698.1 unnamed protein product [Aspergillus oryzae]GMG38078.1 unnamed protein product [Aspergillus oryzae]GMG53131.1 unnamed protein product [Aspergillus oryzae var. brunneus]
MSSNTPSIVIPQSYERLPTTHIKVSHYPAGAETATPVVVVILNRPEKRNAFTGPMAEDLERVFAMFDVDERVKVVVLTGAGNTFCAGADLEIGFPEGRDERPVDHRDSKALYLVSTGAVLPSASPHFGGLFAETLTEQSEVLPRALALATDIAENTSTMANGLNRALIWRGPESAEEAHLLDSPVLYHMFGSRYVDSKLFDSGILLGGEAYWGFCRDNKEGVMSFFEKRKPNFKDTLVDNGPAIYPWWTEADISRKPKVVKGDSKL